VIGQYVDWRLQAAFCAIIPVAFHCLIFFIPESPRYLVEKEKLAKAEKAMYWLKGVQTHPELVKWEMSEIRKSVFALKETKFTVRDTFRRPIVKPTLLMFGIMFFTTLSGFDTVIAFTVHIFESAGSGIDPGLSTIIIGIVSLVRI
jgi:SP family arabinose:H+ symporter-like MFS transporter